MRDKATYIMGGIIIFLLISVVALVNNDARKDGEIKLKEAEIKLLQEKLSTAESVNQGLKTNLDKLLSYNECMAKIFITPRSQGKAIAGSIEDPVAALERCRIEVDGTPISENLPADGSRGTASSTPNSTPGGAPAESPSSSPQPDPPDEPDPPEPPEPPESILPGDQPPVVGCVLGILCI